MKIRMPGVVAPDQTNINNTNVGAMVLKGFYKAMEEYL